MIIVPVPADKLTDKDGNMTSSWGNYFDQNTQQMQQSLNNEGFWIPSVSSANDSVTPPASGGQLAQIAASYGQQNGVNLGTLVYDPNTDQLKVFLYNSGSPAFKAITTS